MDDGGNRTLLEKLWRKRAREWVRLALGKVRNRADAEDVVQEAVFRTLRADPEFDSEEAAEGYVLTAIRTTAAQQGSKGSRRSGLRNRHLHVEAREEQTVLAALLEEENRRELRRRFRRVLAHVRKLPPEQRQALELTVLREEPMKLRELAEVQGVAISTAHSRLTRALEVVRASIQAEEED